jgi:heme-degrading monooxygenase HmoA
VWTEDVTVGRIWRTRIDPRRGDDYRSFAQSTSVPMFLAHEGFRGVIFGEHADERLVITLWESRDAVEKLNRSPLYLETVARLEATGFISDDQSVETFDVHTFRIPP